MDLPEDVVRFMPLFWRRAPSAHGEVYRLGSCLDEVLNGDDPEAACDDCGSMAMGGIGGLVEALRAGLVPLAAIECMAGLMGLVMPRDEQTMALASQLGWDCAPATRKATNVTEMLARVPHVSHPILCDDWGRLVARPTDREDPSAPPSPASLVTANRIVPLGVGGITLAQLERARPIAWHNRHLNPTWAALTHAIDFFAGRPDELGPLLVLVAEHPGSTALGWLAEVACRVADEPARAAALAVSLDADLASGRLGRNSAALADLRARREALCDQPAKRSAAWRALATHERVRRPALADKLPGGLPERDSTLREAARAGNELARALVNFESVLREDAIEVSWERESQGPYHGFFPARAVCEAMEPALDEAFTGFRVLYALELLREARPALASWLAATSD